MTSTCIPATDLQLIELKNLLREIVDNDADADADADADVNTLYVCQSLLHRLLDRVGNDALGNSSADQSIESSRDMSMEQRVKMLEKQLDEQRHIYEERLNCLRERYRVDMACEEGELTEASSALEHARSRINELQHALRSEHEMQRNSARAHELLVVEMQQELNRQRDQHYAAEQKWTEERNRLLARIQQMEDTQN